MLIRSVLPRMPNSLSQLFHEQTFTKTSPLALSHTIFISLSSTSWRKRQGKRLRACDNGEARRKMRSVSTCVYTNFAHSLALLARARTGRLDPSGCIRFKPPSSLARVRARERQRTHLNARARKRGRWDAHLFPRCIGIYTYVYVLQAEREGRRTRAPFSSGQMSSRYIGFPLSRARAASPGDDAVWLSERDP